MKYKLLLIFFFIVFVCNALSSDVKFYSINDTYGLPKQGAFSVCKDHNGFIWTSFQTGIIRISDVNHQIYQLPFNTPNVIWVKVVYENSLLIAYSNNGQIFLYDEIYDKFNLLLDLREATDTPFLSVGNIWVDEMQNLWAPTSKGLYKYNNNQITSLYDKKTNVTIVAPYDSKSVFIASENGIDLIDIHTLKMERLHTFSTKPPINVSGLFYNKKTEVLWVGTTLNGLFFYNMNSRLFYPTQIKKFPRQPILSIEENDNSSVFVGIDGQGVWELSEDGNRVLNIYNEDINNPSSLSGDGVYDIFSDDKRVWVATHGGGLSFFEKGSPLVNKIVHQLNNPNSLVNNYINDVIEDRNGHVWFATNNGISRWNMNSNEWRTFYQDEKEQAKVFLTINEDSNGNIWSGTYSSGIYVMDGDTGRELAHYSDENQGSEFSGKFVYDFFNDSEGDIWIGGIQNMICYMVKEKHFRSYTPKSVRSLKEIAPGKMLLACTSGLVLLDKETGKAEYLLPNYLAQDICIVNDEVWLATAGDGLIQYSYNERKEIKKYTIESGLISNNINSLIAVNNYLWIGVDNGLCRLNISDNTITSYSSIYALSNVAFNVNACIKLKNGNLLWGTNDGAIMYHPDSLYQVPLEGNIFFQNIHVSGRSIRENDKQKLDIPVNNLSKIDLQYDRNTIALELIPMGESHHGSKFSWMMEGLDTGWSKTSNNTVITYANLPAGKFQLKIRMHDNSLSQITDERLIAIHVKPPFWNTWWFQFVLFVVVTGFLYYLLNYYIHHLKRLHAEDKIRFFINMAHDIRTSLTLITAPIEELNKDSKLSEKSRHFLHIASEQSKRLSFVATQLLDFQKVDIGKGQLFPVMTDIVMLIHLRKSMFESSAKRKKIELIFLSNLESYKTAIDELKMEKVIDNLLSNAIKYSYPNSQININLNCGEKEWSLEVRDYGCGISEKEKEKLFKEFYRGDNPINSKIIGSGIGLLLAKNYVRMHNGNITLQSKENEGASFRLVIPYKEVMESFSANSAEALQPVNNENKVDTESQLLIYDKDSDEEKKHLLIVEDNGDLLDFLKRSLQSQYKIFTACDGAEAWDLIQKKAPDMIVSDIMMPNMDGFELCKLLKSTFETSHIPVILLTALSDRAKQLEGLGLGADDYITKPFDMTLLLLRIKTIINNRKIVREKALTLIKQSDSDQSILKNELNDQFIKKALKVVRENIANCEFGKNEFASAMCVSPSLLYKKIKALTNQSTSDFIKSIRLNYALGLLQSRKYTVTEVSELSGFSSINYFSRTFKSHFGKTPTSI